MHRNNLLRVLAPGIRVASGIESLKGMPEAEIEFLQKILTIDYMGNGKFENGRITSAVHELVSRRKDLAICEFQIDKTMFYLVAPKSMFGSYMAKIVVWSSDNDNGEYHGLSDVVSHVDARDIRGWLDLDEFVFFSVDKEMAEAFKTFLQIYRVEVLQD
jgi:hypothetical protein